jgi:poly(3-hydroxybutyrate) depolymerase
VFQRKPKTLTTEDAPASIAPWEMLDDAEIASSTARVRERDPLRNLTAFARRVDQDTVACFDKGADGKSKAVVVLRHGGDSTKAEEHRYSGFSAWFDDALAASRLWQSQR